VYEVEAVARELPARHVVLHDLNSGIEPVIDPRRGDIRGEHIPGGTGSVGQPVRHGRPAGADLTLFKAMGIGLSDLAPGLALLELARERGLGRELPAPRRAALDFSHLAVPAQVL